MTTPLRFHWSLSQAGDPFRRAQSADRQSGLLNITSQVELCQQGERFGIESVLMAIGFSRPDPILLSVAIGLRTERMKFMIACRSGLISPTFFVQQINTASAILKGRVCVNIVSGHTPHELGYYGDMLSHDERYERTHEFLTICRSLWSGSPVDFEGRHYRVHAGSVRTPFVCADGGGAAGPEIFLGGNSEQAVQLALEHGECLWRFPDTAENLRPWCQRLRARGVGAGLLVSLITRPSREEALQAAAGLVARFGSEARDAQRQFAERSDSEGFRSVYSSTSGDSSWLGPCLWNGAVAVLGPPAIALVGSFSEVASVMLEYQSAGVGQFLFTGWPDIEEIEYFGRGVLPLIRQKEREGESQC